MEKWVTFKELTQLTDGREEEVTETMAGTQKAAQSQEIWRAVLEYKLEIKTSVFLIYFVVASTFLVFSYFFWFHLGFLWICG